MWDVGQKLHPLCCLLVQSFSGSSFNSLLGQSATARCPVVSPNEGWNNLALEVCSASGSAGSTGMPHSSESLLCSKTGKDQNVRRFQWVQFQ